MKIRHHEPRCQYREIWVFLRHVGVGLCREPISEVEMSRWKPSTTLRVTGTGSTHWETRPPQSTQIRFVMASNFTPWCVPSRLSTNVFLESHEGIDPGSTLLEPSALAQVATVLRPRTQAPNGPASRGPLSNEPEVSSLMSAINLAGRGSHTLGLTQSS